MPPVRRVDHVLALLAVVRDACGIDELDSEAQARVESLTGDPEVARRVASALGWTEEELPVAELFWGIREFLESIAQSGPVVVVIDDVHWAAPTLLRAHRAPPRARHGSAASSSCAPRAR